MSNSTKLNTLDAELALAPFKDVLGNHFPKIVADVKSMLGRITDKEVIAKPGSWKAGAKFKLTSKEGYTVQLPPNNPATILLCFGMRLNELAEVGVMDISATIPKNCEAWVDQHRNTKATTAVV